MTSMAAAAGMLVACVAPSVVAASTLLPLAQANNGNQPNPAAGIAACGGCGAVVLVVILGLIVLNILLLVWVFRDAKARNMESALLWMLLVMFTGLIGLVIYILARPKGDLVECPNCHNKRLAGSTVCPHCGAP